MKFILFYIIPAFIGFRFGGIFGAFFMVSAGYSFQRFLYNQPLIPKLNLKQIQSVFYNASFAIMGHIAKLDNKVCENEINTANLMFAQFKLTPEQKKLAQYHFKRGAKGSFILNDELLKLKNNCSRPAILINLFLEMQVTLAIADGTLQEKEKEVLENIFEYFDKSKEYLEQLIAAIQAKNNQQSTQEQQPQNSLKQAYETLGVKPTDNFTSIKKSYRKQMQQHHPDKLMSRGLPEEMIEIANQKSKRLIAAYDIIKKNQPQ